MMDLALCCQSRMVEGGIVPPHSVLAPGTALGFLPQQSPGLACESQEFLARAGDGTFLIDHDMARVWPALPEAVRNALARWPQLPEPIRQAILALVESAVR